MGQGIPRFNMTMDPETGVLTDSPTLNMQGSNPMDMLKDLKADPFFS